MLKIYKTTEEGYLIALEEFERGCWVNLICPTEDEIQKVSERLCIHPDFLKDPLDPEERSRIEFDNDQTLILADIPVVEDEDQNLMYSTLPLGMILTEDFFITVCLKENPIIAEFTEGRVKSFFTFKKTRFVLQILFKTATYYLRYLKQINKATDEVEKQLHRSMKNQELFALLNLEKSLVYFTTSLKANEIVMEKLLRGKSIKLYEEDQDLLEDVIIENKQAIEMTHTYSNILSGMMGAFAAVISNNLNIVMKFLTIFTIVLALPTMVSSFFGMNLKLPFEGYQHAFTLTLMISFLLSTITILFLAKKRMF